MMPRLAGSGELTALGQSAWPAGGLIPSGGDQPGMDRLFRVAAADGQLVIGLRMTEREVARILAAGDLG